MKDLSIIIVTYKGWSRLEKCLEPLSSFSGNSFSSEIIIIDNTPDQDEIKGIRERYPDFIYLHNPVNGGYGNGSNIGAGVASGEYFLFLNPDTAVSEEAISGLLNAAREKSFMISTCRQVNGRGRECVVSGSFPRFGNITGFMRFISGSGKKTESAGEVIFPDWVSGSLILVSKSDFRRLNGFDEDFWMYYEDVDICKRASDSGGKVAIFNGISIEHNHGGSSRINPRTTALTKTEVLISRHVYISKHKLGAGKFLLQSFIVINNFLTCLATAIPGLLFFFIPKLFVRTMVFFNLLRYYTGALFRSTWISTRSANSRPNA